MKENDVKKENTNDSEEKSQNIFSKGADLGKKFAKSASESTKKMFDKIKESNENYKKEKLNPLFPKEYKSKSFHIPNIIKIVDDAERRNIALCDGAMGWRGVENNTEILFLYDEARDMCGLEFIPSFDINAVYYVDKFDKDRKRFIKADCIFSKAQEEKVAELENIAYCLGAKSCIIQMLCSESETSYTKKSLGLSLKNVSASVENKQGTELKSKSSGAAEVIFEGHNNPVVPELKWFESDYTIRNLIKMRCENPSSIKHRILELSGTSLSVMNVQSAVAIDCIAGKAKGKGNFSIQNEATEQLSSKLIFEVEF